jgi:deoxyribodipyrimidine photo-lyase
MPTPIVLLFRELRLEDNTVLNEASKYGEIYVIFIFTEQTKSHNYFSPRSFEVLKRAVYELNVKMNDKLNIFYGNTTTVISDFIKNIKDPILFATFDYTPYARNRAEKLKQIVKLVEVKDHTLTEIKKPYLKFTSYHRIVKENKISNPHTSDFKFKKISSLKTMEFKNIKFIDSLEGKTLREKALNRIKYINSMDYNKTRNIPSMDGTSKLSVFLKYGIVSIREVYHAVDNEDFKTELHWRDFYYQVALNHNVFETSLNTKYNNIKWINDIQLFKLWRTGTTGYPLVDAGMRQLNELGWMHNRLRMITASFLVKVYGINWIHGERYFAQNLIDYDPCQNNGGWQWVVGCGASAQPYFRIFSPDSQLKTYDTDGVFVKEYIPELKEATAQHLQNWSKKYKQYQLNGYYSNYKYPNIDYHINSKLIQELYKEIFKSKNASD